MRSSRSSAATRVAGLAVVMALVAAGCTSGPGRTDPASVTTAPTAQSPTTIPAPPGAIVVVGEHGEGPDAGVTELVLANYSRATGVDVVYLSVDDANREFERRVGRGEEGDVYLLDSVRLLTVAAIDRDVRAVPRSVHSAIGEAWSLAWTRPGRLGDVLYGVPIASSIDSLIWYQPGVFDEFGYDIPRSWNSLVKLVDEAVDDELTPFCGFPDSVSRASAFIDWTFDLLIRSFDISVYDSYLVGSVPFDEPDLIDLWVDVRDLMATEGSGFDLVEPSDNGELHDRFAALAAGECLMIHGGPEVARSMPPGTAFADGTTGAIDVITMPGPRGNLPFVSDVTYAVSTDDRADVWNLLQYLGSAEFATDRRAGQGPRAATAPVFLSAASGQNIFQFDLLELSLLDLMSAGTESRERWSESMPQAVRFELITQTEAVLLGERRITRALENVVEFTGG